MKRPSCSSSSRRASSEELRYEVVRVHYHRIHSMLPREAVRVERTDGRLFRTFTEAAEHARTMDVGGEYTYAPLEIRSR